MNKVHVEALAAFLSPGVLLEKLDAADARREPGIRMRNAFEAGVGLLAKDFPNERIRVLMRFVWDLVGYKITPVGIGPDVQSISLAMAEREKIPQAYIFLPLKWIEQLQEDAVLQMGALVFTGSQALDFYNQKLVSTQDGVRQTIARARAHEAEFLLTLKKVMPEWAPGAYQTGVINEYPEGVSTPSVQPFLYTSKPFVPPA